MSPTDQPGTADERPPTGGERPADAARRALRAARRGDRGAAGTPGSEPAEPRSDEPVAPSTAPGEQRRGATEEPTASGPRPPSGPRPGDIAREALRRAAAEKPAPENPAPATDTTVTGPPDAVSVPSASAQASADSRPDEADAAPEPPVRDRPGASAGPARPGDVAREALRAARSQAEKAEKAERERTAAQGRGAGAARKRRGAAESTAPGARARSAAPGREAAAQVRELAALLGNTLDLSSRLEREERADGSDPEPSTTSPAPHSGTDTGMSAGSGTGTDTGMGGGTGTSAGGGTVPGTSAGGAGGAGADTGTGTDIGTGAATGTGTSAGGGTVPGTSAGGAGGAGADTGTGTDIGTGAATGTGTSAGSGTVPGTSAGGAGGAGTDTGTGTDTATSAGTGAGAGAGRKAGAGRDAGADAGTGLPASTGAGLGGDRTPHAEAAPGPYAAFGASPDPGAFPAAGRTSAPASAPAPASASAQRSAPGGGRSMAAPARDGELRRTFPPPARARHGGGFAETWWGNAWVAALEEMALDAARLGRGKAYAGQGHVDAVTVTPGLVLAYVHGSRPRPYRVQIRMRTLSDDDWERFLDAAAERPAHIAALLDKELPQALADSGVELLPGPGDLVPRCSCPDSGHPCKHAAALCYQTARLLDEDPFVLLLMRGRGERELLDELSRRNATLAARSARAAEEPALPGVLAREAVGRRVPAPPPAPLPPPAHPQQPPAYPASPGGPDPFALDQLATDAAARAHALLTTGRDPLGGLTLWQDAVRLAATRPGSGLTATTRALYAGLATAARRTPGDLARAVAAWRQGGLEGLAVLEEAWDPPAGRFDRARPLLLAADFPAFRPWHNHLTHPHGHIQLRLGHDGLWYAYESEPGHDDWWPRGTPDLDPVGALTGLGSPTDV
ncbi:SWIM zinc finger family protein [Streptomyces sp. SD18]